MKEGFALQNQPKLLIINYALLIEIHGGVAQLGEHLPCKQGVRSSTLLISTKSALRADSFGLIAQVVRAHA